MIKMMPSNWVWQQAGWIQWIAMKATVREGKRSLGTDRHMRLPCGLADTSPVTLLYPI